MIHISICKLLEGNSILEAASVFPRKFLLIFFFLRVTASALYQKNLRYMSRVGGNHKKIHSLTKLYFVENPGKSHRIGFIF